MILVVLIIYVIFISGDKTDKTNTANSNIGLNLEQTSQINNNVEKCTSIEDSEAGWLPLVDFVPSAVVSHKNDVSKWDWNYNKSIDFKIGITLKNNHLFLQYEFLEYKSQEINISDAIAKLSVSDENLDIKLVTITENDYHIFAVFSFQEGTKTTFLKLQCSRDTFTKVIYSDIDITDVTIIYSADASPQNPIHDVILRCEGEIYSIEIVSSDYYKKMLLPETIQNPVGFYHDSENIYIETTEETYYTIYVVDFINSIIRKITDTNKVDKILSMREFFSLNSLDLFVVGEYKNSLAVFGHDGKLGGLHKKELFSLIDKTSNKPLLYVETSNINVPTIRYHIDCENGYCYLLHDTYIKKIDMLTGKVIWKYESNGLVENFTKIDNVIYLTKENAVVIIDSSTGKKISEVKIDSYTVISDTTKKAQKVFILKDKLNNTVKLLNKYGKVVKEFSGSVYYNNNEIIILKSEFPEKNSQIFKYISLDNPVEATEIALSSNESLHVLSSEYLIITESNSIKLFSAIEQKYIWEKEIEGFRSAKVFRDNIYISGEQFICASIKEGQEKWRVTNNYNAPIDYIFSLGKKLFVTHNVPGINRSAYRVYNIDTGKYLYQISDFPAVIDSNISPFYEGVNETYISKYDGSICIVKE